MRLKLAGLIAVSVLLIISSPAAWAQGTVTAVVAIDSGPICGEAETGVHVFRGIPYAAPPVGQLRWQPPQPVAPWTQVLECKEFGPACPQPQQSADGLYSEDCLYLNVWTPAKESGEKLPVMVWIHGGAFNFGAASWPEYDGKNLALQGVVAVTVNYRLGPLGFLVHPLLSAESLQGVSGNYGLLDQMAALQWVKKNIAAFGGDPARVTIFGQSAGSRSVALQMISPLSAGLFQGAIAQSGGPIIGSEYLSPAFNGNMRQVAEMGQELTSRLGCDKAADILDALRAKPAQEVVKQANCSTSLFVEGLFFAPVFDGWVLPQNPWDAYRSGRQHPVPLITGSTLNEGNIYLVNEPDLSREKYRYFMESRFGGHYAAAEALFPAVRAADIPAAIDKIVTVAANAQPARFIAQSMGNTPAPAYLFQFTRRPDTARARKMGVHHGVELAYVFGNMTAADGYNELDRRLSQQMMGYWVNFAKTGDPNGPGLPAWPAYHAATDMNLEFGDTIKINKNLYKKEADFIERIANHENIN